MAFCKTCGTSVNGPFCPNCGQPGGGPQQGQQYGGPPPGQGYGGPPRQNYGAPYQGAGYGRRPSGGSGMRIISPIILVAALLCFFLPFSEISCQGQPLFTVSGFSLALGIDATMTDPMSGQKEKTEVELNIFALLLLLVIAAGIALSFVGGRSQPMLLLVLAGIAIALMVILAISILGEMDAEAKQMGIEIKLQAGYWLVLMMMLALGAFNFFQMQGAKR